MSKDKSDSEFLFIMLEMAKHDCVSEFEMTGDVKARLILGEDINLLELSKLSKKHGIVNHVNQKVCKVYKANGISYIFYGYGHGQGEEFLSIVCFDGSSEFIWINKIERHGDEVILCGWDMLDDKESD